MIVVSGFIVLCSDVNQGFARNLKTLEFQEPSFKALKVFYLGFFFKFVIFS